MNKLFYKSLSSQLIQKCSQALLLSHPFFNDDPKIIHSECDVTYSQQSAVSFSHPAFLKTGRSLKKHKQLIYCTDILCRRIKRENLLVVITFQDISIYHSLSHVSLLALFIFIFYTPTNISFFIVIVRFIKSVIYTSHNCCLT